MPNSDYNHLSSLNQINNPNQKMLIEQCLYELFPKCELLYLLTPGGTTLWSTWWWVGSNASLTESGIIDPKKLLDLLLLIINIYKNKNKKLLIKWCWKCTQASRKGKREKKKNGKVHAGIKEGEKGKKEKRKCFFIRLWKITESCVISLHEKGFHGKQKQRGDVVSELHGKEEEKAKPNFIPWKLTRWKLCHKPLYKWNIWNLSIFQKRSAIKHTQRSIREPSRGLYLKQTCTKIRKD